ncbi:putative bifunctional diguanylate cyclase/phosphodiesterase [Glaciecola sp.]|jgi:diguanylate cyclase (GGDEF)-like protein|uniref:putative bifunctional diguanylate cyclase/phosphodiesterase n=1 Tax=Glaciecola sp. MF2-115 TaxID=3384827 RepID=UPI00398994B9
MLKVLNNELNVISETDEFRQIRSRRLMQISGVILIGLLLSVAVAKNITLVLLLAGIVSLLVAFAFAYKGKRVTSAYILMWSMTAMLSMLSITGAGLFDLAILGYPCILIMAALLGSLRLFVSLLTFIVLQCILIGWLTLHGHMIPHTPRVTWAHLVFILIIFLVTAYCIYIMVCDIKHLLQSFHSENEKVKSSKAEIQHLAHHDVLTNLPNRLYGEELFHDLLDKCQKNEQKLALMFIDLDNFKPVNDALGHAAGDELLKQLSNRLVNVLPYSHKIIRFGGDEFLVLAPCEHGSQQLSALANNIIENVTAEFVILANQVSVSASIGIACAPTDGTDFKQLCRKADIAMYRAKEDGRNNYHYYDDSLDQVRSDQFELLQRLRQALNEQQFELYYQPIIELSSKRVSAVEALIRWPQEDGSMIGPDQFIPLAESSGLINELGRWVIHQACKDCALWRQQGFPTMSVAINLSVVQFKDGHLPKTIEDNLNEFGLSGNALELELTESLLIVESEHIQKQLDALNELGAMIAIDDFGTGYSNLSYLRKFNASTLKIDRSFISTQEQWKTNKPLVKAIIQMAKSLGLQTVAEGIENEHVETCLSELGCSKGQGYYWSPAVPSSKLPELLAQLQP